MSPFVYSHIQEYNIRCQLLKGDKQSTYCSILSLIHDSRINTTDRMIHGCVPRDLIDRWSEADFVRPDTVIT